MANPMSIEDFAQALLERNDLDSSYCALHKAVPEFGTLQFYRFLIAYLSLDHFGAGCFISEFSGNDFWMWLEGAAAQTAPHPLGRKSWEIGGARIQRRGKQLVRSVAELKQRWGNRPEAMIEYIAAPCGPGSFEVSWERVLEHWGMGPWVAFKMLDMLERVAGVPVYFTDETPMAEEPQRGAIRCATLQLGLNPELPRSQLIKASLAHLRNHLGTVMAPPTFDRVLNIQEFETIFCKWHKHHAKGTYPPGMDVPKIAAGLEPWVAVSPYAKLLSDYYEHTQRLRTPVAAE